MKTVFPIAFCLFVLSLPRLGYSEDTLPTQDEDKVSALPRLTVQINNDGSISRREYKTAYHDIGVCWSLALRSRSVQKQIELVDSQYTKIASKLKGGKVAQSDIGIVIKEALLPHQIQSLEHVIRRYRCLSTGVLEHLRRCDTFKDNPISEMEIERIAERLKAIAERYQATTDRELKRFDVEVRKMLTRDQLARVEDLIGESRIVDVPLLDFAILQLEDLKKTNIYSDIEEAKSLFGRSAMYELELSGRLTSSKNNSSSAFLNNLLQLLAEAGISLDAGQRATLRTFQTRLSEDLTRKSRNLYDQVTRKKMTIEEAKVAMVKHSKEEARLTLLFGDDLLDEEQGRRVRKFALDRHLRQCGVLSLLTGKGGLSKQFELSDQQRKKIIDLADRQLRQFRVISREVEEKIWESVHIGLNAEHRRTWLDEYGEGSFEDLPASPYLLLYHKPS